MTETGTEVAIDSVIEHIRENVRLLKAIRRMADEAIAKAGGYTSRQVLQHRLSGRTDLTLEDLHRIAAALRVEPEVLLMAKHDAMSWVDENPNYEPPRYEPQPYRANLARR